MKKTITVLCVLFSVFICLAGCRNGESDSGNAKKKESISEPNDTVSVQEQTDTNQQTDVNGEEGVMYITIGETTLVADLESNSSAEALLDLLEKGDLTLDLHDYGDFEKVGSLGTDLPTNDEQITTKAGDLILYQGNQFVIYYDTNSWNFTSLGKIRNVTGKELRKILGDGNVKVVLSVRGDD